MQAIKQLYRIGHGPSSSHTIAPYRIAVAYRQQYPECERYRIVLGASLAMTAKGHGTLSIIEEALECHDIEYVFQPEHKDNIMNICGFHGDKKENTWHAVSLGGGAVRIREYDIGDDDNVYEEENFEEIKAYLKKEDKSLLEYIYTFEPDLKEYLKQCLEVMFATVRKGLSSEGLLNKDLNYYRIAKKLYEKAENRKDYLVAYSYAACEENAAGGLMCTAPTLGSCGVLTSLMYYLRFNENKDIDTLCDMLAIGGVFGNCIKNNASIAGSVGGCQAEIGTATAMAAAAISYLEGYDLPSIEYAAEMGVEHFLGLTCDPVMGYVIIPCIERNAISIMRAYDCAYLTGQFKNIKSNAISFDSVVKAMNYTGQKLATELKETSLGGLSLEYRYAKH